jgi:cytochrome c oxidase cbb3-type subunit 2
MSTPPTRNERHGWFSYAYAIVFIAGLGFFALSFIVLAVIPGRALDKDIVARAPQNMPEYSPSELRGREVYGREGCAYCHTQQVRFVTADVARWGASTEAWETKFDYPQLWGTRRIGPDLARETGVRTDDWQLTHLFDPRATVRDSVMPPYPWLFDGQAGKPTPEGIDLVAYLQTLGRARVLSGYDEAIASGGSQVAGVGMDEASNTELAPRVEAIAAQARQDELAPQFGVAGTPTDLAASILHGGDVFAANCASCHGPTGAGDGPASATLQPKPANLRAAQFDTLRLSAALWNGVTGTAMPAWRDLPPRDLQDVVAFMGSLHRPEAGTAHTAAQLAEGAIVFEQNCASCHGTTGEGNGPAGRSLERKPTNFHLKQPDEARAEAVVLNGIAGTSMPAWKTTLAQQQRDAVVAYLRSLYGQVPPPPASHLASEK